MAIHFKPLFARESVPVWIGRFYGLVLIWHSVRHFTSYALLGSQSSFSNPLPEWIAIGILQVVVGCLLLYRPNPTLLISSAIVVFVWCMAYPVGRHVGDSSFIVLLLGLSLVFLGGNRWIPLATLPSVIGLMLASLWKLAGGNFSLCDLTHCLEVRFPWTDALNEFLNRHSETTYLLSQTVICIEFSAPFIWALLFFPKLWKVRSYLAIVPILLLIGIGLTGNLDEFPWVMTTAWLLMIGPISSKIGQGPKWAVYVLAFVLYSISLFNAELNLRRLFSRETEYVFEKSIGILPDNRMEQMAIFVIAPYWNMYAGPINREYLFGGEAVRIEKLQSHVETHVGCGLVLSRWERIYWERIGRGLKEPTQRETALTLIRRYEVLEGRPCSLFNFPNPSK